ncbi:MAG: hypothetical protein QM759_15125 [Terricaulis sp.]
MSSRLAFVLHRPENADYASALATALNAFVAPMKDGVRFGAGAICVLVWDDAASRERGAEKQMLERLPAGVSNTVLCCIGQTFCPDSLRARAARFVNVSGRADGDAAIVSALVDSVDEDLTALAKDRGRRTNAPQLASRHANGTGATYRKSTFAGRSATGLVATLAIVGIVGPIVVSRPQATAAPNPLPKPSAQPVHTQPTRAPLPHAHVDVAAAVHAAPAAVAPPSMTQHAPAPFSAKTRVVSVHTAPPAPEPTAAEPQPTATPVVQMPDAAISPAIFTAADYVVGSTLDSQQFSAPQLTDVAQLSSTSTISAIIDGRVSLSLPDDMQWGLDTGASN